MKRYKVVANSYQKGLTRISNTPNRHEFENATCDEIDELINLLQEIRNKCSETSDYGIRKLRRYVEDVTEDLKKLKGWHIDIDDGFRSESSSFAYEYHNDIDQK